MLMRNFSYTKKSFDQGSKKLVEQVTHLSIRRFSGEYNALRIRVIGSR